MKMPKTPNVDRYLEQFDRQGTITLVGPMTPAAVAVVEPVIFVDGGANWRQNRIGLSVGDGDSSNQPLDIVLNPHKDFSDLAFALDIIGQRFKRVNLIGFVGGRQDHQLLNFGAAAHFLHARQQQTVLWFEQTIAAYSAGRWAIEVHGTFSLIVFTTATVELSGDCKYPILPATIIEPVSSFGLSNQGHGVVTLDTGAPVFIFHNKP